METNAHRYRYWPFKQACFDHNLEVAKLHLGTDVFENFVAAAKANFLELLRYLYQTDAVLLRLQASNVAVITQLLQFCYKLATSDDCNKWIFDLIKDKPVICKYDRNKYCIHKICEYAVLHPDEVHISQVNSMLDNCPDPGQSLEYCADLCGVKSIDQYTNSQRKLSDAHVESIFKLLSRIYLCNNTHAVLSDCQLEKLAEYAIMLGSNPLLKLCRISRARESKLFDHIYAATIGSFELFDYYWDLTKEFGYSIRYANNGLKSNDRIDFLRLLAEYNPINFMYFVEKYVEVEPTDDAGRELQRTLVNECVSCFGNLLMSKYHLDLFSFYLWVDARIGWSSNSVELGKSSIWPMTRNLPNSFVDENGDPKCAPIDMKTLEVQFIPVINILKHVLIGDWNASDSVAAMNWICTLFSPQIEVFAEWSQYGDRILFLKRSRCYEFIDYDQMMGTVAAARILFEDMKWKNNDNRIGFARSLQRAELGNPALFEYLLKIGGSYEYCFLQNSINCLPSHFAQAVELGANPADFYSAPNEKQSRAWKESIVYMAIDNDRYELLDWIMSTYPPPETLTSMILDQSKAPGKGGIMYWTLAQLTDKMRSVLEKHLPRLKTDGAKCIHLYANTAPFSNHQFIRRYTIDPSIPSLSAYMADFENSQIDTLIRERDNKFIAPYLSNFFDLHDGDILL